MMNQGHDLPEMREGVYSAARVLIEKVVVKEPYEAGAQSARGALLAKTAPYIHVQLRAWGVQYDGSRQGVRSWCSAASIRESGFHALIPRLSGALMLSMTCAAKRPSVAMR